MRFKLDENLPTELEDDLVRLGHDADSVVTEGLGGADDASGCRRGHSITANTTNSRQRNRKLTAAPGAQPPERRSVPTGRVRPQIGALFRKIANVDFIRDGSHRTADGSGAFSYSDALNW